MLASTRGALVGALLLSALSGASAISFWDFQRISGFPGACASAYRTPLPSCSSSDFKQQSPCSTNCAVSVQQVANLVNSQCAGVSADPSTLIGLIFSGKAVAALCPSTGGVTASAIAGPSAGASTATSASSVASITPSVTAQPAASTTASSTTANDGVHTSGLTPMSSQPTSTGSAQPAATANPNSFGGDVNPFQSHAARRLRSSTTWAIVCLVSLAWLL